MPDELQQKRPYRGCAIAVAIAIVVVGFFVWYDRSEQERLRLSRLQKDAERAAEFVQIVKNGDDGSRIFFSDQLLAGKLAADPQCVANLRIAYFFMADVSEPGYADVRRLTSVWRFSFYDCGGVGTFLANVKGMPSIEEMDFGDTLQLGVQDIPIMASFPNLKKVHLGHVVSAAEKAEWKKTLPNAEIEIEFE